MSDVDLTLPANLDRRKQAGTAVVSPDELSQQLAMCETPEEARSIEHDAVRLRDMLTLAGKSVEEANKYGAVVLDAARKIGELLNPDVSQGERTDLTLRGSAKLDGLPPETKRDYRKFARIQLDKVRAYKQAMDELQELYSKSGLIRYAKGQSGQLVQQSLSDEHYTPERYIKAARDVLGDIDLDPASCAEANEIVQAKKFYSEEEDGLKKTWRGRVWLNPPYGRHVGTFVAKLIDEFQRGNVKAAVVLVNAHCTDTSWFQGLWNGFLCFTDHRINFYGDDARSGSTHGSVFVYFGPEQQKFIDNFKEFGCVVARVDG